MLLFGQEGYQGLGLWVYKLVKVPQTQSISTITPRSCPNGSLSLLRSMRSQVWNLQLVYLGYPKGFLHVNLVYVGCKDYTHLDKQLGDTLITKYIYIYIYQYQQHIVIGWFSPLEKSRFQGFIDQYTFDVVKVPMLFSFSQRRKPHLTLVTFLPYSLCQQYHPPDYSASQFD